MKKFILLTLCLLPILAQAKCFYSNGDVNIYSVQKLNSFQAKSYMEKNYIFCLNNYGSKGTLNNSDSTYEKIGTNTYVAFNYNDTVINFESIQVDTVNKMIKYTKNLNVNPDSPYVGLTGLVVHTWNYK